MIYLKRAASMKLSGWYSHYRRKRLVRSLNIVSKHELEYMATRQQRSYQNAKKCMFLDSGESLAVV